MNIEIYGWISLPKEIKDKLAGVFHIPKRGTVHVSDGRIIEDGFMKEDLTRCLTLEAMQKYTGSTSDKFIELLSLSIEKVEGNVVPPGEPQNVPAPTSPAPVSVVPRKRGRPPMRPVPPAPQS
jgi:hypothetical protein